MKMNVHRDEDTPDEMNKITRGSGKAKAVAMALNERARRSRLKRILAKGSGVPARQLDEAYDPRSLAVFRVVEDRALFGRRHSR
jgi:hypothetical protein